MAEDAAFWQHDGIDLQQIRESIQTSWEEGVPIRGASTITQQLAKNLYLSPSRDPLRKLRELIIARRLEAALPKERIFEIYRKGHDGKKYGGMGLGLTICSRIVSRHNGRIWVESTPGEGSTFFFILRGRSFDDPEGD